MVAVAIISQTIRATHDRSAKEMITNGISGRSYRQDDQPKPCPRSRLDKDNPIIRILASLWPCLTHILCPGVTARMDGLERTVTPHTCHAAHLLVRMEACAHLQGTTNTTAHVPMVSTLTSNSCVVTHAAYLTCPACHLTGLLLSLVTIATLSLSPVTLGWSKQLTLQ